MLQNKKIFYFIILMFAVLGAGFFAFLSKANAEGEVAVTNVTRITPADYRSAGFSYGVRDWSVWNKNNDRMMVVESSYDQHPVSGK